MKSSSDLTKEEVIKTHTEKYKQLKLEFNRPSFKAVETLDRFTKEFCIDATVKDDLEFRCKECPFAHDTENEKGLCMVKEFKNKFAPDYVDFGSMGDL